MNSLELSIDDLIPYIRNPRKNDEAATKVAASIKEFGFKQPIVVDKNMIIVAGHTRLLAAQKLGLKKVPVIIADDLTESQIKAYRIADNRVAEEAEWDYDLLKLEINDLVDLDFDLIETGFSQDELDNILNEKTDGLTDPDEVPEAPEEPTTKLGDIYILGNHRLMCGDSTSIDAVDKLMDGCKFNALITSPPYWNQREYSQWTDFTSYMVDMGKVIGSCVIQDNAIIFWNIGDDSPNHRHISAHHSLMLEEHGLIYIDAIIWKKQGVTGIRLSHQKTKRLYYPGFSFENCLVFQKENNSFPAFDVDYIGEIPISNVWEISTDSNRGKKHSAPFPVKLPETAIKCYTNKVLNKIYDPFLGSGTTLIACEKTNRICYGMELDPKYCDVIVKRWENFTGNKAALINREGTNIKLKEVVNG